MTPTRTAFDEADTSAAPMAKRRRGFPSETNVKRGVRVIHTGFGDKTLDEKLGRRDPCPCGSGRRFQPMLSKPGHLRRRKPRHLPPRLTRKRRGFTKKFPSSSLAMREVIKPVRIGGAIVAGITALGWLANAR